MEVNGQVLTSATWEHREGNLPALPPMQLAQKPRQLVNRAHWPAPGLRMTQIAERRSESDVARWHPHLNTALRRPRTFRSPFLKPESSREAEVPVFRMERKKSTGSHSNKPYNRRFNYARLYDEWDIKFPGDYRAHNQAFSSRLYRENIYPTLDGNGELARDRDGKPIITAIGIRKRHYPEFRDFPFELWAKNPEWALYWDWVLPEHKAMAQKILEGRDLDESQLRKERSRRAICLYEAELPANKGWFATPALHAAAAQTSLSPKRAATSYMEDYTPAQQQHAPDSFNFNGGEIPRPMDSFAERAFAASKKSRKKKSLTKSGGWDDVEESCGQCVQCEQCGRVVCTQTLWDEFQRREYSAVIPKLQSCEFLDECEDDDGPFQCHARVYVFAEMYAIADLRSLALDKLHHAL
ncbi:hypothetical protein IFR05_003270 [Cadophora sp. M221]|nr:hypothetical protein IFR05_003270 [Cadophora sp. M221]